MKLALAHQTPALIEADVVAIGVTPSRLAKDPFVAAFDKTSRGYLQRLIEQERFKGDAGTQLELKGIERLKGKRVLLVGLGQETSPIINARLLGHKAAQYSRPYASVAVALSSTEPEAVRAITEGLIMGAYRYQRFLTGERKPKDRLRRATVLLGEPVTDQAKAAMQEGTISGGAVNFVRDLVNCPANELTPSALADAAKEASAKMRIQCQVFGKKEITRRGMNLLLAVNRGSAEEPRFIHMTYQPQDAKRRVVFVGKGITFDSGGLCLKPSKSMVTMKCDMAGAALTVAVVAAAAAMRLPIEVHGVVAATENMTGGNAYRPGDVFTSLDGKTVEIINTDAEGRLVLADALSYARELAPDLLIDHATLTGACMVALGPYRAGLFSNDEPLAEQYASAAAEEGERVWRLPLDKELRDVLKSAVADLKHCGDGYGGSITAALFLQEFVGKARWAHMDIAGPAYLDKPHGTMPKGATGFGVLTALAFLRALSSKP
ncbi:MAG: leucyl aminopeptidase [Myxococcales bacterium]|nr:leucyl aminopeptidase [Myxococcales bacterium]